MGLSCYFTVFLLNDTPGLLIYMFVFFLEGGRGREKVAWGGDIFFFILYIHTC